MPALTRFTFGALNPLTLDLYTIREISEYRAQLHTFLANGGVL